MNDKGLSTQSLAVAKEILCRLINHPDAKDTADGILHWWLKVNQVHRGGTELEDLLHMMVKIGWLEETKVGGFSILYGVNRSRLDEIQTVLGRLCEDSNRDA